MTSVNKDRETYCNSDGLESWHDRIYLTHRSRDKKAVIFANNIFDSMFVHVEYYILLQIALKFVTQGPINNEPTSVQWVS